MSPTAMPGGTGTEERARARREAPVCVRPITGHNCLRHSHTTDARDTPANGDHWNKSPCDKIATVQTAGSHETQIDTYSFIQNMHPEILLKGKETLELSPQYVQHISISSSGQFCVEQMLSQLD